MTLDRRYTIRAVLVLCGGVPFLFFLHTAWARAALLGYLLTACLFGLVLVEDYPPIGTSWFWKAMIPIVVGHSAIVLALVRLDLDYSGMNEQPRIVYSLAAIILVVEAWLSQRVIQLFQPSRLNGTTK